MKYFIYVILYIIQYLTTQKINSQIIKNYGNSNKEEYSINKFSFKNDKSNFQRILQDSHNINPNSTSI